MAYDQLPQSAAKSHSLELERREKLSLSGVEDVMGFDENMVVLQTGLGRLTVRGERLHIGMIDLDSGRLELSGKVQELSYDETVERGSLWQRLFG